METTIETQTEPVLLTVEVHPELRQTFKIEAARRGTSMKDIITGFLCKELNRPDLLEIKTPEKATA